MTTTTNRFIYILFILFISCGITNASTDNNPDDRKVILQDLVSAVRQSADRLDTQSERCSRLEQSADIPTIKYSLLSEHEIHGEQAAYALLYLSRKNYQKCIQRQRNALAYDLELLDRMINAFHFDTSRLHNLYGNINSADSLRNIIYPDKKDILIRFRYDQLPSQVKSVLEQAVGDKPFLPLKAIEKNHLAPPHSLTSTEGSTG